MTGSIRLHYHRPPDRTDIFVQRLVHADDEAIVTYLEHTPMERALVVDGAVALEHGSPAIWFTFPGRMHDVGRFHTRDGRFTGLYANILMPVELVSVAEWSATDLFLDVWIAPGAEPRVLDADELEHAVAQGWVSAETAAAARAEAREVIQGYQQRSWPPVIVNEWTLQRVCRALA